MPDPRGLSRHSRRAAHAGDQNLGSYLNRVIWTLAALSGLFIGLRLYSKLLRRRHLWWDDYVLIASWVRFSHPPLLVPSMSHILRRTHFLIDAALHCSGCPGCLNSPTDCRCHAWAWQSLQRSGSRCRQQGCFVFHLSWVCLHSCHLLEQNFLCNFLVAYLHRQSAGVHLVHCYLGQSRTGFQRDDSVGAMLARSETLGLEFGWLLFPAKYRAKL